MSYEGEVIAKIPTPRGELELRKLTPDERAVATRDLFLLVGASHWNPADFFTKLAEDHEILAAAFRECEQFFDNTCPECGLRDDEVRDDAAPRCSFCKGTIPLENVGGSDAAE